MHSARIAKHKAISTGDRERWEARDERKRAATRKRGLTEIVLSRQETALGQQLRALLASEGSTASEQTET